MVLLYLAPASVRPFDCNESAELNAGGGISILIVRELLEKFGYKRTLL